MRYYLSMFGISLGLTLAAELIVAAVLGLRGKDRLRLVVLVNILTNPAAVWLHNGMHLPQIPIEILVVLIEYYVYKSFAVPHPLAVSLAANGVSWGIGLMLMHI